MVSVSFSLEHRELRSKNDKLSLPILSFDIVGRKVVLQKRKFRFWKTTFLEQLYQNAHDSQEDAPHNTVSNKSKTDHTHPEITNRDFRSALNKYRKRSNNIRVKRSFSTPAYNVDNCDANDALKGYESHCQAHSSILKDNFECSDNWS